MRLRIAIPSRERAARLEQTLLSIKATTGDWNERHSDIKIRIDDDDPQAAEYWDMFNRVTNTMIGLDMVEGPSGKYIGLINEMYGLDTDFDAFMCGTDDIIFETPGWFEELEKINTASKYWVAWFNDDEKLGDCAQAPFISKAVIDVLGTPLYSKLGHFYSDLWITMVARGAGIDHYIPTHKIIHMTPKNGRVPKMDSTFVRVRLNEQVAKDTAIFRVSNEDMDKAIKKLKKAIDDQ